MKKREEADSGLRAGFVHEEQVKQEGGLQANPPANDAAQKDEQAELGEKAKAVEASAADTPKQEADKGEEGPQVSVKGVSGKMITGVIKAVKKVKPKAPKEPQTEQKKAKQPEQPSAEAASVKAAESSAAPAAKVEVPPVKKPEAKVSHVEKKEELKSSESKAEDDSKLKPDTVAAKVEAPKVERPVAKVSEKQVEAVQEKESVKVSAPEKEQPAKSSEKAVSKTEEAKPVEKPAPELPVAKKSASESKEKKTAEQVQTAAVAEDKTKQNPQAPRAVREKTATPERNVAREQRAPRPVEQPKTAPRRDGDESVVQGAGRAAAEGKQVKRDKPRVKSDSGVILSAQERLARAGKTIIRPQSGNYVGRDSSQPAFKERRGQRGGRDQDGGRDNRGRYQGSKDFGDKGRGRRDKRSDRPSDNRGRENFFDKDKDEEDVAQRSRPRRKKRSILLPDPSIINQQKDASRRNYREKSQRDRDQHGRGSGWRSREEMEFNEEAVRRARRRKARTESQTAAAKPKIQEVELPESMTVKDLAEMLKRTSADVITKLISLGVMATVNQEIDYDTAAIISAEFGVKPKEKIEVKEEDILFDDSEDDEEDLKPRPPVVVVMGHVDHGKTSVLDWIRNSRVALGEAGGITQHIGAYMVDVNGKPITFLDTPGHEAFTAIRARGAQVTDLAVLVVAADDGVMPQTIEAINHAKAANTEIIVAINKIDKPGVNIDRVKQELAAQEILDSDWGGTTTMVPVSAKTGENMDELLEMIVLTSEVLELKANPERQAKGTVIEASLDKNRGAIATLLVQRGTLEQGDTVVVGTMMGNVRAMFDDRNRPVKSAGPSVPVEIMGLPDVPAAGDIFYQVEDERLAKSLVERRQAEERERELSRTNKLSLENLFEQMNKGETKDLNIILKADVQGSIAALATSLEKLSNDEVTVHIIHSGVGSVTASDIRLADVSNAVIIGFNVRPTNQVKELADEANVEIRLYSVIYEAIEEVEKALVGMLDPVFVEEVLGHAEVREIYKVSGVGTVAGCYVTDGLLRRNAQVRVVRGGIVIHEGKLASLKRFQDDAREVNENYECGLSVERFNDLEVEDVIECFHMKETKAKL